MRTSTSAALGGLLLGSALLAGCGSSGDDAAPPPAASQSGDDFASLSATDIESAAKADTKAVSSVHLNASFTSDGMTESLDLQLDDHGTCTGTLGIDGKGTAQILGVGGKYWFKPDAAFWQAQAPTQAAQIIALVGDKYVVGDDFKDVCDLDQFLNDDSKDKKQGVATVVGPDEVDGQPTVKVSVVEDGSTTVADVLTSSPHYVVKLVSTGKDAGTATLSDFGAALDVTAPTADQQIDLGSTGG